MKETTKDGLNFGLKCVIVIISAFVILFFSPVRIHRVSGESMMPNYTDGQFVFCIKNYMFNMDFKYGDTVVIYSQVGKLIKRVIGMPGDKISLKEGRIYVNDSLAWNEEDFPAIEDKYIGLLDKDIILQDDEYFCVGDNRNNSTDSRKLGVFHKWQLAYLVNNKL